MSNSVTPELRQEFEDLVKQAEQSPIETLPKLDEVVERMVRASGYSIEEEEAGEREFRSEVVDDFLQARAILDMIRAGAKPGPQTVRASVEGYEHLFSSLAAEA